MKVNLACNLEIKVPESGGRVERHRIHVAWSPVWSFWSPGWFGLLWCLQVLVHCVVSSPKSVQLSTRRFWITLCFHLLTSFIEMLISFSSRTLAPVPQCINHFQVVCWPWYYCSLLASQHVWPEAHLDSMGYFQEKDEKQSIQQLKTSRRPNSASAESTVWSLPCHSSLMLEFVLKEPRPSIQCRNEHTFKHNLNFSVLLYFFFIDPRKYSYILRYRIFDFFEL